MPNGSRLRDFVRRLGKASVIALGKADLADDKETKRWIKRFADEGLTCVALDSRDCHSVKSLTSIIKSVAFAEKPGQKIPARKVRRVMVIGIPNVGKSTLINSMAGRKAARTANMPGVTRSIQWIKLSGELELLDLPGILDFSLLRRGDILRLINTVPGRGEDTYTQARNLTGVLSLSKNQKLLPGYLECEECYDRFLEDYARRMNFCMKGGIPDIERAATDIIKRFQSGGFGKVTLEPADHDFTDLMNTGLEDPDQENSGDEY